MSLRPVDILYVINHCAKVTELLLWYFLEHWEAGKVPLLQKVGQTSRSRSQGQKLWYHVKGLIIRYTDMKYESSIFNGLKVKG